jgi:transposase
MKWIAPSEKDAATNTLEKRLWEAADQLRANANAMELLGPTRPDPHKGPYNADGFVVDVANQRAACPEGKTSTQSSHIKDSYMGTEYYRLEWGSQCDGCPAQRQCTRAKSGRRILVVGLRHDLIEQRRKEMKQAECSRSMYPRNDIEGTHSELVRGHGLKRTKYRGLNRVSLLNYFIGAASTHPETSTMVLEWNQVEMVKIVC